MIDRAVLLRCLLATALVLGAPNAWAAARIGLVASPYEPPAAGGDVVVAIAASDLPGVTSMDLSYTYNPIVLTPTGVFLTGFTSGFSLTSNLRTSGRVDIHLDGPAALYGSGELAWVTFHIDPGATTGTTTPMSWVVARLNGGTIPCSQNGTSLPVAATAATVAAPKTAFGVQGARVAVPISGGSLSGGSSIDLTVTFDPTVVTAYSVQKTSFTNCMTLTSNIAVPGTVRVSLYGMCSLTGSGPLVNITFTVVGPSGRRTPLNVTRGAVEEDRYRSVLQDGLFNVCASPDADGDGYSTCAGDCNDASVAIHPGAFETCNGLDDDCNAHVDDALPPTGVPGLGLARESFDTRLSWAPVPAATRYDVVRGDIGALLDATQGLERSTDFCLFSGPLATIVDGSQPVEGEGYWYLVRPANCGGPGSFDDGVAGQILSRDLSIGASPYACP